VLGVDLVEPVPDGAVVVEVEAAGEGDLGAGRHQHLGLGAALRGEEVTAVDDGGGEGAVVDLRAGAQAPGRGGVALVEVGGVVAEELHGSRRSMSVRPLAMRRSSSTERISEPSCSFWLRFCATSLLLRSRATRPAARWNRLTAAHSGSSRFEAG